MTEYITKEAALEAIRGKMWPGEIEAAIKAIPADDVAPIEYASWIEDDYGYALKCKDTKEWAAECQFDEDRNPLGCAKCMAEVVDWLRSKGVI